MNQKKASQNNYLLLLTLILVLAVGGGIYAWQQNEIEELEAEKNEQIENLKESIRELEEETEKKSQSLFNDWQTKQKENFSFSYPEQIDGGYLITPSQGWPPQVIIKEAKNDQLVCESGESKVVLSEEEYCFSSFLEGAAGKEYKRYSYRTIRSDKRVSLTFTIGFVSCGALDQIEECEVLQEKFEPHDLAEQIFKSINL